MNNHVNNQARFDILAVEQKRKELKQNIEKDNELSNMNLFAMLFFFIFIIVPLCLFIFC